MNNRDYSHLQTVANFAKENNYSVSRIHQLIRGKRLQTFTIDGVLFIEKGTKIEASNGKVGRPVVKVGNK